MKTKQVTIEIYRKDKRTKQGERLIEKQDYVLPANSIDQIIASIVKSEYPKSKYRVAVFDTFVERRSAMDGTKFTERYDTPYFCSPSSETYWCS